MLRVFSLAVFLLPTLSLAVTLGVAPSVEVSVATQVDWSRTNGDPTVFDLRIVHVQDERDLMLVAATVQARDDEFNGTTVVTFPLKGIYTLKAIDFNHGNRLLATSNEIHVEATLLSSSTTGTPASTVTSTSTSSATETTHGPSSTMPTNSPSSQATTGLTHRTKSAIIGGVIGGVAALMVLVVLLCFLIKRRRDVSTDNRRYTFHRDFMVQRRSALADLERGTRLAVPLASNQPSAGPTPQRPTRDTFPPSSIMFPAAEPAPTDRQLMLDSCVAELESHMAAIRRQNRGQQSAMLEQIRTQMDWLRQHQSSPWALYQTDEPPPGLELYLH